MPKSPGRRSFPGRCNAAQKRPRPGLRFIYTRTEGRPLIENGNGKRNQSAERERPRERDEYDEGSDEKKRRAAAVAKARSPVFTPISRGRRFFFFISRPISLRRVRLRTSGVRRRWANAAAGARSMQIADLVRERQGTNEQLTDFRCCFVCSRSFQLSPAITRPLLSRHSTFLYIPARRSN